MPGTRIFRLGRAMFHAVVDFADAIPEPREASALHDEDEPSRPQVPPDPEN